MFQLFPNWSGGGFYWALTFLTQSLPGILKALRVDLSRNCGLQKSYIWQKGVRIGLSCDDREDLAKCGWFVNNGTGTSSHLIYVHPCSLMYLRPKTGKWPKLWWLLCNLQLQWTVSHFPAYKHCALRGSQQHSQVCSMCSQLFTLSAICPDCIVQCAVCIIHLACSILSQQAALCSIPVQYSSPSHQINFNYCTDLSSRLVAPRKSICCGIIILPNVFQNIFFGENQSAIFVIYCKYCRSWLGINLILSENCEIAPVMTK